MMMAVDDRTVLGGSELCRGVLRKQEGQRGDNDGDLRHGGEV